MKRVLVLLKRTLYTKLVLHAEGPLVPELLREGDRSVERLLPAHRDHEETVEEAREALASLGMDARFEAMPRRDPIEGGVDLVLTIGGDGTLLAASHLLGEAIPLLGINSAPDHSVGYFCAARKGEIREVLSRATRDLIPRTVLTRMQVEIGGKTLHRRVLNDALFCHSSPAATSRYILTLPGGLEEEQKSSGVWVGPAAGSTAAQRSAGGLVLPLSSTDIQYVVREPYVPPGQAMRLERGIVAGGEALTLVSQMMHAKLFLDGEHNAFDVTMGDRLAFRRSPETVTVLGLRRA